MDKKKLIIILIIIFIITTIGILWSRFISTKGLRIKEYSISTTKLNNSYNGLKIVHFSDLHYGSTIFEKELKSIIKSINSQNPDIIVFTGDLVENHVVLSEKEVNKLTELLNQLTPNIKTYAVKGNHDYDHNYWDTITPNLNWKILDNTYDLIYYDSKQPIAIVGFDDLLEGKPDYQNGFSYLNEIIPSYTIVLLHEPDQIDKVLTYSPNLVLAGHSHGGQVRIPFIGALFTPIGSKKYYDEHYKLDNTELYISYGLGTSTLRLRFNNKPSYNLYRFYTK